MLKSAKLAREFKALVSLRTGHGVRELDISVDSSEIVLRGKCQSFYCKQLAQEVVLASDRRRIIHNEISVD